MKEQNFSNHTQYVPGFHLLTYGATLAALTIAVRAMIKNYGNEDWTYTGLLPFLIALVLLLLCWYSRAFALKAQDRAIRAEENLRHFILTGKPLPSTLRISQIVALRFASDPEFVSLVQSAASENLSSKAIKQSIKNWKADHYRV